MERYILLSLHFSPAAKSRLSLVCKAVILERIASATACKLSLDAVIRHVGATLGQQSELIAEATRTALSELVGVKLIELDHDSIHFDALVAGRLAEQVRNDDRAEQAWVQRMLREQAAKLSMEIDGSDTANVTAILDDVLLAVGREVAELLLFNRPPKGELERVEEIVESYCSSRKLESRTPFYRKTIKHLVFNPAEGDEDLLFKRLQSYFIASAFVLNPTSEKLIADYSRDHWVYLDSSIILPGIAIGHPANSVYKRLLQNTHALGEIKSYW